MKPLVKEFWTLKNPTNKAVRNINRYWFIDETTGKYQTRCQVEDLISRLRFKSTPVKVRVTIEEIES